MNRYLDSQGLPLDNAPHNDVTDDPRGLLSADEARELDALQATGIAAMNRFYDLAPEYYWRAIEMERLHRAVLHDAAGAAEWQVIVDRVRARILAQIESEKTS